MKKLVFILFFLPAVAFAQKEIKHTVVAKESLTSIGRLYNINGRVLAEYNHIDYDKGLTIGQVLRIPVEGQTQTPVQQTVQPTQSRATGTAIYHDVAQGEGLYGISKKYNTTIEQIKQWNHLSSDGLDLGMRLIVGYNGSAQTNTPAPTAPAPTPTITEPIAQTRAEEPEPVSVQPNSSGTGTAGIFQTEYVGSNGKKETGEVSVFKSTSGWEDGKYYCLHDSAPIGSIVKVSNPQNGKIIYAKVLDIIPELTENKNSILILSNAAVASLEANDAGGFDADVEW